MKLKSKKKKGFTLIELVAVVAILAILAAVLVPSVSGYITRSRKAAVITQCREVVNAVATYNLTAQTKILDTANVETLTAKDTGILIGADLLTDTKLDKIKKVTVKTAKEINEDEAALDKITLNKNDNSIAKYGDVNISNNEERKDK